MKNFNKILILMVVISVITSAFVFSASAEDSLPTWNGKDLTGTTWTFSSGWTVSANTGVFSVNVHATNSVGGSVNGNSLKLGHGFQSSSVANSLIVGDAIFNNSFGITLTFNGGSDVTNSILISWLLDYGELTSHILKTECDGSTCPAIDVNLDSICDDCGLPFALPRNFTPSDFPSGYPSVPSVASDARYYLYRVHSSVHTYIVVYPSTVTPTYDTTKQNGYLTFSESYGSYRLDTTNNEWVLNNDDSPYSIGGTNNNSVDVLYSSVTIKDENGENFFPIPLWEKVEKVTQGEIPQFNLTVGGSLMTLTLCGVGLITLLVALYLLSKTFRTYLR